LLLVAGGVLAVRALSRSKRSGVLVPLAALGVCGLVALGVFAMSEPGGLLEDFRSAYYPAGSAVLSDPAALASMIDKGVGGFVNLPIVAYLFAPFAVLDLRLAAVLFSLVGLASILAAWALLVGMAQIEGGIGGCCCSCSRPAGRCTTASRKATPVTWCCSLWPRGSTCCERDVRLRPEPRSVWPLWSNFR
jgi:hypothetical protein